MSDGQSRRLEGVLMGCLIGLHVAGAVYRWVRSEPKKGVYHASCAGIELLALLGSDG